MKTLHEGLHPDDTNFISKEEQRKPLCSNNDAGRCSSLDFNSNSPLINDQMRLEYLADLIVDIYLAEIENGNHN